MTYSLGIMQGRLTPPQGRGIQFFPFDNWEREFALAAKVGLNEIEFIFDLDRYEANPLWSESGRADIKKAISTSGVKVNHICADFFMRRPFFRVDEATREENVDVLKKLIEFSAQIGARTIEIPLVDNSSIKNQEEKDVLNDSLHAVLPVADRWGVTLGLETDLPPQPFVDLLNNANHPLVKANYDSGNSSGLGYDPDEEVVALGGYIHNIHIKDRVKGGGTVSLGMGSADFDRLFKALKKIDYQGSFILQTARGVESEEAATIENHLNFVKQYIQKYLT